MGGAVGGAPTSTGQGGSLGLGGLPMAAPAQQAPVGAPPPVQTPAPAEPTGLQFGTAGVGTGIVQAPQTQPQMQPQMPQYQGLQMLLNRMLGSYQQAPRPLAQSQYQNRALAYRPNMSTAQQALSRTATSQAAAQAAAAAKAAQTADEQDFANWLRNNQRQQYEASKNPNYGGG